MIQEQQKWSLPSFPVTIYCSYPIGWDIAIWLTKPFNLLMKQYCQGIFYYQGKHKPLHLSVSPPSFAPPPPRHTYTLLTCLLLFLRTYHTYLSKKKHISKIEVRVLKGEADFSLLE